MRKNLLVILALLLGITTLQAKPVDMATAQRLGLNFVQHKAMFAKNAVQSLDLAHTFRADNGMATAYVFNFDGGFVVVAADDCSLPIIGYSDQGRFDYGQAPDGLLFMMDETSRGIATMVAQGRTASSDVLCCWKNLEDYGVMRPERNNPLVGPLVQQRWNQDSPYNMYCPSGCPTGCVATAMAQLMKYWDWPTQGTGEHSYQWNGQTLSANFGETTYDWDNMIDYYGTGATQEQKQAVATLMYHCGVSVNMMYEPGGSGAYSADVPIAINTYFSYSDRATHIAKGANYDEWIALLKSNIDQHIPIYYSGQSSEGGHAFVCDGYDADDLFHFNWGWGGSSNGYFLIDGKDFDYTGSQAIVYDFVPDHVFDGMPKAPEGLSVNIDSDVSLTGHLSWVNPTETEAGLPLTSLSKVIVKRNGAVVQEIENVQPGQAMTYDDEAPFFDQYDYAVLAVDGDNYGRTSIVKAVFGPYCEWTVIMTSANFQGWNGGGITVQNAAGSYIDFLTTTTSSAQMQRFQMALGNNNLYWTEPNSAISNLSFKIKDAENQIVYQYEGPSSGLEAGLLRTLNNSCGNEVSCAAPYHLLATVDPDNDQTIVLSWDSDDTPEFGYCIYRDGLLFNMSHELSYVDENTTVGGHCYYVTALCTGGETANSNEYCATSGTGCEPPYDLRYSFTSNNKVQLDWNAPDNASPTGYFVYRKTGDEPYKRIKSVKATTLKDNTAVQGTVYQYAVSAYYDATDCTSAYAKAYIIPDEFFVEVDWSTTPVLQAELDEEETTVSLRWQSAFQATSYSVVRNGATIGEVETVGFDDEDLTAGETYCYQIVAHGADYETTSNEACVTTPEAPEPPEPPVLPCPAPTDLRQDGWISIRWTAPEDRIPDSYTVVIIDHMADDAITEVEGITETVFVDTSTEYGIARYYKVKAVYPECESEFALADSGDDFIFFTDASVGENALADVKLYPNPASDLLTVEAEGMTSVSVFNLVGQCVLEMPANNSSAVLDMSRLQAGVYMVKVNAKAGSVMQKVVKM